MNLCPDSEISILSVPNCISQYVSRLGVSFSPSTSSTPLSTRKRPEVGLSITQENNNQIKLLLFSYDN